MRNPDRIDDFLTEIGKIWHDKVPDWRFGQLMYNFLVWTFNEKKRDIFFPEEDEFLKLFKEYFNGEDTDHE